MRPVQTAPLDLGFALTGVGTALLGAALPATLHQWRLNDAGAGLLFLAGWGGSTSGALFARGRLDRSAAAGLALSAVCLVALSQPHPLGLILIYFLYGVGLGTTMTAISLLRSSKTASGDADLVLNRLNLLWAVGACLCPVLALRSLRLLSVTILFRSVAGAFLLSACAIFLSSRHPLAAAEAPLPSQAKSQPWAPWRFALFAAASVGLESALGSWLTTYAERSTSGIGAAVSANSAFWFGLLLSRGAHSLASAPWFHTPLSRHLHVALIGLSIVLLLLFPIHTVIPAASFLSGFGLGPLYPYVLSLALPQYRSLAIFVVAGVGASVVPWLTGALSSASHSLRVGLFVPAVVFVLLAYTGARIALQARQDHSAIT